MVYKNSGVYKITNTTNNKVYIGSSISLTKRLSTHFCELKNNVHCNRHLQNSYNKYGPSSFKWLVLELCSPAKLIKKEQRYIDQYRKTIGWEHMYNIRIIAHSNLGIKRSEETLVKMSLANKGEKNPGFGKLGKDHPSSKPVEATCIITNQTFAFANAREAARQRPEFCYKLISACCLNKRKTHKKHVWRFKNG